MTKIETSGINGKYSLTNNDNYNNFLICNLKEIIDNYIHILLNYILLFHQKININDDNLKYFILKKGISAINHTFLLILYYTKNLEIAFYHSKNSYIFYVEFIEQLNFTSSTDSAKITVNDAITFIYKKNIYCINNSNNNNRNSNNENEKQIFVQLEELLKIHLLISDIFGANLIELKNVINNLQLTMNLKDKNIIYHFLNMIFLLNTTISQKRNLLFLFIDELNSKKNINFASLKNNIQLFDFGIDDINSINLINLLFR